MKGNDFIQFAAGLAARYTDPSSCRAAINRAYYGAYHLAKALLEQIAIVPPRNANTHAFIRHRLANSGQADAALAASLLVDLYTDRLAADYDISNRRIETVTVARACVERAVRIQSALTACATSDALAEVRAGIQAYESRLS